ncbi:MAG: hypothetical protein F6K24_28390 [Okeania sp. SIO2D1]|nr:hypothetical protein [Okeania sp. SIO2D1]
MTQSQDIEIVLTLAEINKILDALGNMPYREVFELVGKIQTQAEAQLQPVHQQQSNSEATQITTIERTP